MALGSTQTLTEMSIEEYFLRGGGKGGRCVGLTTLPASIADCPEVWESHTPGTLRTCNRLLQRLFYLYLYPHTTMALWNSNIYSRYRDIDMVDDIKFRRLEWAGHIIRMEE